MISCFCCGVACRGVCVCFGVLVLVFVYWCVICFNCFLYTCVQLVFVCIYLLLCVVVFVVLFFSCCYGVVLVYEVFGLVLCICCLGVVFICVLCFVTFVSGVFLYDILCVVVL